MRTLLALVLTAAAAPAASPHVAGVVPVGGTRGAEVTFTFVGTRLADAVEVVAYEPGILFGPVVVESNDRVRSVARIAADCPPGEHAVRVRAASGLSELRTIWVGTLPVVAEVEPNSDFDRPQPVGLNTTVTGVIDGEDVDYFVVECKKGQRLAVEVEGMRLGREFWDPFVAVLDARRFELATSDDAAHLGQDAGCQVVIPADGKYVVQLRESAYGGNGNCHYRLHVGTFPRPTGVVPAGGRPGDEVEFRFVGDLGGDIRAKVKLPAQPDPNFRVFCTTPAGTMPAGFKVRVADLVNTLDTPAAADPKRAAAGPVPGAFHGVVAKPGERRVFKFAGKKGAVIDVACYARRVGSPLDPVVHLHQANGDALGGLVGENDDADGSPDSHFRATLPADADYYLTVHDHLDKGGPDYFFRVEVGPVTPATVTSVPRVDGNNPTNQERQAVAVPRGGRMATLVTVTRADWDGPAGVGFTTLPAGVSVASDPAAAGQGQTAVVFDARPDAPLGAALAGVLAAPVDPKVTAGSRTAVETGFNLAQPNNTAFHKYTADRLAVAVTEAAPYTVAVVEPKAALPHDGSMNLRVVVTRAAGFKGPVTVYPLFVPPGVGVQGSATVAPDQTECVLGMNAAGNAPVRAWKSAVIAQADAGKGPVWASSQLFAVTVGPVPLTINQDRAAVEQGQKTQVVCKLDVKPGFAGKAVVKLAGLPAKAAAADREVTAATKEVVFDVTTDKDTPAGKHRVFCQVLWPDHGETISLGLGGNELRVDVPLPPKVAPPAAPAATAAAAPKPADKPPEKRLTRLEQLRVEQEAREKAGTPAGSPK